MSALATVQKLQRLLTSENIKQLDRVLALITDPSARTYTVFWQEIEVRHSDIGEAVKGSIYSALLQLKALVREYGGLK